MSESGNDLDKELEKLSKRTEEDPAGVYDSITEILDEVKSISNLAEAQAMNVLGILIDSSNILGRLEGINRAIEIGEEYKDQNISRATSTRLHYRLGNAYSQRRKIQNPTEESWRWENRDLEKEIYNFRLSLDPGGLNEVTDHEACQIYTNLGNALSEIGRVIEALRCWDKALSIDSSFAPAQGQKGIAFYKYAQYHYDGGHQATLLRAAYEHLDEALQGNGMYPEMRNHFEVTRHAISELFKPGALDDEFEFDDYSLGDSDDERDYRKWCLNNGLFLNALNDIGPHSIAAQDILHLASVSGDNSNKIVSCVGFYNQMKQEYVSARYLLYEGIHTDQLHFADKDTHLENTLDYPDYSIHAERVRIALRMAYSIFDKIASFIQYYYGISYIDDHKLNFGNVWYKSPGKNQLAPEFENKHNWPLRGLFWLSKDLDYSSEMYVEHSLDPGAKELRDIRNDLEHGYLKLHQSLWPGSDQDKERLTDELATSYYRDEFEQKALAALRKIRAALIYLSLSIRWEEAQKDDDKPKAPINLGKWEDDWKR